MSFDTVVFLFIFLPCCMVIYFLSPRAVRNLILFVFSLLFMGWSQPYFGPFSAIATLVVGNYFFGHLVGHVQEKRYRRAAFLFGLGFNLTIWLYVKYSYFFAENRIFQSLYIPESHLDFLRMHSPLGISFIVFTMIAYLLDVYSGLSTSEKNPLRFGLFTIFFPKLVAGPIVRYREIEAELKSRLLVRAQVVAGVERFVIGLAKKTLIANNVTEAADQIFALEPTDLGTTLAWLGILCYTIQIYFDFSAYTDMAIGLGLIFGFQLPENFNYPYAATSIIDFWRRWHITLSNWLRDYIFLPLSRFLLRRIPSRTFNMVAASIITMLVSGIWHGVGWNFVVWGLIHGALMAVERVGLGAWLQNTKAIIGHFYALLSVMLAWVFFRTETLQAAFDYLAIMLIPRQGNQLYNVRLLLDNENLAALLLGIVFSTPLAKWLTDWAARLKLEVRPVPFVLYRSASLLVLSVLFALAVMGMFSGSYTPFLYFRF